MYGAILGDMIGSPYEFDQGNRSKTFPLFSANSMFTDDTVMTIAVAEALMDSLGDADLDRILAIWSIFHYNNHKPSRHKKLVVRR